MHLKCISRHLISTFFAPFCISNYRTAGGVQVHFHPQGSYYYMPRSTGEKQKGIVIYVK
ncbi:MAG: hypothetical protein [Olavius algarvensis Delta 4 endosymbiont]|nr:MAG: hypothetical protein [Olavius algarvensis Delta 4 endosymbiont]